jgi:hypothetical protein
MTMSIQYVMYEETWAEKRRDKLIFLLKRKKAFVHKIIVFLLMIPIGLAIISITCLIVKIMLSLAQGSMMGIACAEVFILGGFICNASYLWLTDKFETNPNYIWKVKHKGKFIR